MDSPMEAPQVIKPEEPARGPQAASSAASLGAAPTGSKSGLAAAVLAGVGAGLAMAALDHLRALPQLGRFLPGGALPHYLFLACLYGGAAGVVALVVFGALRALLAFTPVAGLLPGGRAPRVSLWAVILSGLPAAVGLGGLLYGPTLQAQVRFHHPGLIAALLGAAALGLALPALILQQLVLGLGLRLRRRVTETSAAEPGVVLAAAGWITGAYLFGGAVSVVFSALQKRPRMTPALRALNLSLWTPALALLALTVGVVVGRALRGSTLRRAPVAVQAALPLGVLLLPPLGGWLWQRELLALVDLRAFTTLGVGVVVAAALAVGLSGLRARRAGAVVLLPLLLWGGALWLSRADRVRKAALSQAALAGPLCAGLQAAFDLDRDGSPSRWVIGGSDCDDLDAQVHPGAFDWPDDGIDQDCNGHQASLADAAQQTAWPARPAALPQSPNVVLITIDALRADHVGAYGYKRPTTPTLDALANEGFLFGGAFAHAPSTRYSVPAILTGRYPSTIAWGNPAQHWPPEVLPQNRLLSEMLRGRGYRTTALLSYHYFEPTWGLARGFDDYDVHLMTLHSLGGDPAATSGSSARELADLAIEKLSALTAGPQPFFLWVHFYDPHYRYQVHPEAPIFGLTELDEYDNEIRYTDDHIGRVLAALRASPAWGRTVVAVTADHGEGFGEHGIPKDRRHGYHLYADQTKVPLILRVPGLDRAPDGAPDGVNAQAPRIIVEPVGHVDLVPTLLNLCGAGSGDEPQLLGRSLLPLVLRAAGQGSAPATATGEGPPYRVFQEVMYEGPTTRKALVSGDLARGGAARWHYIRNVIPDDTGELYDLAADPGEDRDVQGEVAVATAERALREALAAWMDGSALPADFAKKIAGNLSDAPIPAPRPLDARIGDFVAVTGVDAPAVLQRGVAAEVAVVLRGLSRVPPGYRLFTHLVAPGGTFVNLDHDPLRGLLPLQRLRPGQHLRDVIAVTIPSGYPTGRYRLELGLYRRGERATVAGPDADVGRKSVIAAALEVR